MLSDSNRYFYSDDRRSRNESAPEGRPIPADPVHIGEVLRELLPIILGRKNTMRDPRKRRGA
ncbi:MAG: hypothetical protein K8U03_01400 [Planctomycetia bacterium]|nr:hypothetical protein [Planctomycetia bacterium]